VRVEPCWFCLLIACSGPPPLATLTHEKGRVERDSAAATEAWQEARVGAEFVLGDGVRTLAGASASLALDDATRLDLRATTTVRFSSTRPAPHSHAFDVQTGAASVQAGEQAVIVHTRIGPARVERGSTILLEPSASGLRFEVHVGRAAFGASESFEAGARVTIDEAGEVSSVSGDGNASRAALARANVTLADPTGAITAIVRGNGATVRTGEGWAPLAEGGSRLASGAELETTALTSIEIERDGQRAVLGGNGHYVLGNGSVLVSVQGGSVLAGGQTALRVEVPGGVILIAAGGQAMLDVSSEGTQVASRALDAVVETGERHERVGMGHSAWLAGTGRLRHDAEPPSGEEGPGDALDFADLAIASGTSAIVHDPSPPTAVRFEFGDTCAGPGSVQLLSAGRRVKRGSSQGGVALSVPKGTYRYELRCAADRKRALGGSITVLSDAATRSIASKPPRTALVADGRKYTVLYQNRLPAIELSWPNAPVTAGLRLVHELAGTSESVALKQPRHQFESGELAEGQHTFYFDAGGSVSRQTSVDIVFDNAAPRASLLLPPVLEQKPGEPVPVAGTALPGSEVWVEGERVPLDARGRFSRNSALPLERRALVIKLVQPGRGTHYYLRRGRQP
jgi:hypothetical protein